MTPPNPSEPARAAPRPGRAPRVLVVDDEADLRELLELTLVGMGLDVDCAADLATARRLIAATVYNLCITDMRLPDGDGVVLIREISMISPNTPVAVITAFGSADSAVAALKAGAFDYVAKPVGLDALRTLVRSALKVPQGAAVRKAPAGASRSEPTESQSDDAGQQASTSLLIGASEAIAAVRETIQRLSRSMAPVAITGESGSGKELAARLIHQSGPRAAQAFVAVNCGAIPDALMEAEFFGYRRGAFTGAEQDRIGFFQAASGGTLFLDEVADLPLSMQVKLLRAIQERTVRRVGATLEEPVDVRILSATHQNLSGCVAQGRFRQDLFYRLNVIELRMPALRERLTDVPLLAHAMLGRLTARAGLAQTPHLSSVALKFLCTYSYPGNVRELENILERALAFSDGEVVNVEDLGLRPALADAAENESAAEALAVDESGDPRLDESPQPRAHGNPLAVSEDGVPASLPDYLEWLERQAIVRALEKTRQNRTAAARLLGISFRALRHRMQRLGMQ